MSSPPEKKYRLSEDQIQPLAEGIGFCFATDRITVEGAKVGFMYREEPDNEIDSGWRFLSGEETQEYLDEDENTSVLDVNVIANYDADIIPLLDAPYGSAFERDEETGEFLEIELVDDEDDFEDDDEEDEDDSKEDK